MMQCFQKKCFYLKNLIYKSRLQCRSRSAFLLNAADDDLLHRQCLFINRIAYYVRNTYKNDEHWYFKFTKTTNLSFCRKY